MKKIASITLSIALLCMSSASEAQLLKNIGKQLQEKIGESQSDDAPEKESRPAVIEPSYRFQLGITYNVSTGKGHKKPETTEMTMWFSEDGYAGIGLATGKNPMLMIYDSDKDAMINIMEESKTYMVMNTKLLERLGKTATDDDSMTSATLQKTGITERILGYACEQYKTEDKDTETLLWFAKDLGIDYSAYARNFATIMKNNKQQLTAYNDMPEGMMLRMEAKEKGGKNSSMMEAVAVHKDGKLIDMASYKSTGFGF